MITDFKCSYYSILMILLSEERDGEQIFSIYRPGMRHAQLIIILFSPVTEVMV